jgi:hypothetical protein
VVDAPLLSSHTALNCPWTHYWLAVLIWPESEVHRQKKKMEQEGDSASLSHGWCPSAKSNITSPLESMYLVCVYVLLAVCFDLMCCVLAGIMDHFFFCIGFFISVGNIVLEAKSVLDLDAQLGLYFGL